MDETQPEKLNDTVFPPRIKEAIELVPKEYLLLSEKELRQKIKPTLMHYEIRQGFWEELAFAQEVGKKMRMWRIYEGKCSKEYFYSKVLRNPGRVAWITSPMVTYEDKTKAILQKSVERYQDLIDMEITTTKKRKDKETGEWEEYTETDPKKAAVLLAVIKNLEDRVKGTAIQRAATMIDDRRSAKKEPKEAGAEVDMKKIDERLKELENTIEPDGDIIEVTGAVK